MSMSSSFLFFSSITLMFQIRPGLFEHISSTGDIILGGLFPVHKEGSREDTCGEFSEIPGYQYMEAMRYAVDQINNRSDILPGIRLGTVIYDTCRSPTITADRTKDLIKLSLEREANTSEFAGVIGPFTSGNSIIVANFLRVFEIPQISYGGLTVELSDKSRYGYLFRTVPPDSFFAEGLAMLLEHFRWNYVSIIHSTGKYPETGTEEVVKALSKRDICVARKHRLPRFPSEEDFDEAINEMTSVSEANVVVFVTIQRDSRGLLRAKQGNSRANRLAIVASVSWSNRDDITKGLDPVAEGTITFGHLGGKNTDFEKYFRSLSMSNYGQCHRRWFEEFWESQFECSLGNSSNYSKKCTGKEDLFSHQMEIAPVRVVINAVYAMAYSLENMRKSLCPSVAGMCSKMKPLSRKMLKKFLENVTFLDSCFNWPIRFNQNNEVDGNYTVYNFQGSTPGMFSYVQVGKWTGKLQQFGGISGKLELNISKIRWQNGTVANSTCSQRCKVGNVKQPRNDAPEICCWDCVTCNKYDIIHNDTCRACPDGYAPDGNFSSCLKLEVKYINLGMPLAIFLTFFAFLGIITNLTALVIFYLKRNHQLIKAMDIETCYFIFSGIFLIFITPIAFLAKPTQGSCYAQRFLLGSSFTICYAALFVKLRRIYNMTRQTNQLPKQQECLAFLGLKPYLVTTISIDVIQVFLIVLLVTRNTPRSRENFYFQTGEVLLECQLSSSVFVACVAGSLILVAICTGYAFLTRNIQKNLRETMYISFTAYISNVLWLVLLVFFLNSEDSFFRQFLVAGTSLLIGWVTLIGLFAPAFYHLWRKEVFDSTSLIDWNSTANMLQEGQPEMRLFNTPQLNVRRATAVSTTSTHQLRFVNPNLTK